MLNNGLKEQIKNHAISDNKSEICGFLVKRINNIELFPCNNTAIDKENYFKIDNEEISKAKNFGTIIGVYHSHLKSDTFSDEDILISEKTNLPFYIYCLKTDIFKVYHPESLKIPYVNRPFILGTFDCLLLVIDYFKRELNISLEDITADVRYEENWEKHPLNVSGSNILKEHFINQGFQEVKKLNRNDIILIKPDKIKSPCHVLIYLGHNKILHHPSNGYSLIEEYSDVYKRMTRVILRHGKLL